MLGEEIERELWLWVNVKSMGKFGGYDEIGCD